MSGDPMGARGTPVKVAIECSKISRTVMICGSSATTTREFTPWLIAQVC